MLRKRLTSVSAVSMLAVVAIAAPAAHADTMGAAACVLEPGSVTGSTNVESILGDLGGIGGTNTLLDTDKGSFTFAGDAICAGANAANSQDALAGVFHITASGRYSNLICGTGTANGTAEVKGTGGNTTDINTEFGITFVGGVGKLSLVIDSDKTNSAQGLLGTHAVVGGEGSGVVDILPDGVADGSNCVTTNVTTFAVNGAFESSLSDDGQS